MFVFVAMLTPKHCAKTSTGNVSADFSDLLMSNNMLHQIEKSSCSLWWFVAHPDCGVVANVFVCGLPHTGVAVWDVHANVNTNTVCAFVACPEMQFVCCVTPHTWGSWPAMQAQFVCCGSPHIRGS